MTWLLCDTLFYRIIIPSSVYPKMLVNLKLRVVSKTRLTLSPLLLHFFLRSHTSVTSFASKNFAALPHIFVYITAYLYLISVFLFQAFLLL